MTTINIKEEANKLAKQFEETTGHQIPEYATDFIMFGMKHGVLIAGLSLVEFTDGSTEG